MKYPRKNKNRFSKKKLSFVLFIVIASGVLGWFIFFNKNNPDTSTPKNLGSINYEPPTEEERKSGDDQKIKNIKNEDHNDNPTEGSSQAADIVLADASQYGDVIEVRAYITNVYEDTGQCKAVFTKDTQTVTQTSNAFKDATTTQCGAIDIPRTKLPSSGTWQMVVEYSSPTTKGSTPTKSIDIN